MDNHGLVVKEQSGFFWVEVDDGTVYMCRLRGKLREEAQASDIAAIGDRVQITAFEDQTGVVEAVEERGSVISRALRTEGNRGAGSPEREHVPSSPTTKPFSSSPPPSPPQASNCWIASSSSGKNLASAIWSL